MAPRPTIEEIVIADPPEAWAALGFRLDGGGFRVGGVRVRLAGPDAGRGIVDWSLREIATTELDGLATRAAAGEPPPGPASEHPNGVTALDHVVVMSPDLDRTIAALEAAGLPLRRVREEPTPAGAPRQAFFRLGETILEVIQEPETVLAARGTRRPARLWGLAFVVADLDRAVAALGTNARPVRDAVQPGRRIAPLARSAGLGVAVALMTPAPAAPGRSPTVV